MRVVIHDAATGEETPVNLPDWDDVTRTVTNPDSSTRPYTAAENDAADRTLDENARLDDLAARVARIEAHLWPAPSDPTVDDAPTVEAFDTVWPAGGLICDGGTIWRNVAGVPLTTPPSGFPGSPSRWVHLFVDVTPKATPPAIPAWVQPLGAHDSYAKDAKVTHKGRIWTSTAASNVWAPGVYGWTDIGPA